MKKVIVRGQKRVVINKNYKPRTCCKSIINKPLKKDE